MRETIRRMLKTRSNRDLAVHLCSHTFNEVVTETEKQRLQVFGMNVVVSSGVPRDSVMFVDRNGVPETVKITALDELAEAACGDD